VRGRKPDERKLKARRRPAGGTSDRIPPASPISEDVYAALAAAGWLAAPWYVRSKILPDLWARYGLTMTGERQDLSIAGGSTVVHGVRPFDGDEEVLDAKRLEIRISLRGLYQGRTVEHLVFDDPVVHARIEPTVSMQSERREPIRADPPRRDLGSQVRARR
jgi:hypothetical protein